MDLEQRMAALTTFAVTGYWQTVDAVYEPRLGARTITCPICGHAARRDGYRVHTAQCQFGGGTLERYGCPACDFVFGPLKVLDLSEQMLTADYRLLYASYDEADPVELETRTFNATQPRAGGVYLNWGSGTRSATVDALRADGWDVWGYEPSVPPASPFVAGSRAEISATFDGLFSSNVVEHFRDPVAEFTAMASHVRPGGLMAHATPCYELKVDDTRFHTAFYLGRSVDVLAERVGLDVVDREHDGDYSAVTFRVR